MPTKTPAKLSEALRKTLDSAVFGIVATIKPDGSPHQSVVWIERDGEDVLFAILHGSWKEKHLLRDSRMTLLVHPADAPYTYASISGTVSFTHEGKETFMERLSFKYTGMTYEEFMPDAPEDHDFVIVRLTPDRIYSILQ
jgi:PPOX class probable F420-dependent enzyme